MNKMRISVMIKKLQKGPNTFWRLKDAIFEIKNTLKDSTIDLNGR